MNKICDINELINTSIKKIFTLKFSESGNEKFQISYMYILKINKKNNLTRRDCANGT